MSGNKGFSSMGKNFMGTLVSRPRYWYSISISYIYLTNVLYTQGVI